MFKYFVEFDEDGEIMNLYKTKEECPQCKEYIVKLIPIKRNIADGAEKAARTTEDLAKKFGKNVKRLNSEVEKLARDSRRFKI
jgi:hypothetical protein